MVCTNGTVSITPGVFTNPLKLSKNNGYPGEVVQIDTTTAGSGILFNTPNVYFGTQTALSAYGSVVLPAQSTISYSSSPISGSQILNSQMANTLYVPLGASLSTLGLPTGSLPLNAQQITGLASGGTVVSGGTNAVNIGDLYAYVSGLPTNTQQVYSITLSGSTTTGVTWTGLSANGTSTSYAQCNFVKGNSANKYITSTALSTTGYTLYGNVCHVLLAVQS